MQIGLIGLGKMPGLSEKKCKPCTAGTPTLHGEEIKTYLTLLNSEWKVIDEHHLERAFRFKNFREALDFTNKVGKIAEEEGHHPDILLSWGKVKVMTFTHKIGGLSENDFILAAKIDKILLS